MHDRRTETSKEAEKRKERKRHMKSKQGWQPPQKEERNSWARAAKSTTAFQALTWPLGLDSRLTNSMQSAPGARGPNASSNKKKNKKKGKNKGGSTQQPSQQQQQQQQQSASQEAAVGDQQAYGAAHEDATRTNDAHNNDVLDSEEEEEEEELPEMGVLDGLQGATSSSHAGSPSLTPATQAELLATANELYRQIEAAAAAALASTGNPGSPGSQAQGAHPSAQQANGPSSSPDITLMMFVCSNLLS